MASLALSTSTWEAGRSVSRDTRFYGASYRASAEAARNDGEMIAAPGENPATSVYQPHVHVTQGQVVLILPLDQARYGFFNVRTTGGLVRSLSASVPDWRPAWLRELLRLDSEEDERGAMRSMMVSVAGYRERREFSQLSEILEKIEVKQFSSIMLIGLLRNTFGFRSHMAGWTKFRDNVAVEFGRRNKNVARALHGLL